MKCCGWNMIPAANRWESWGWCYTSPHDHVLGLLTCGCCFKSFCLVTLSFLAAWQTDVSRCKALTFLSVVLNKHLQSHDIQTLTPAIWYQNVDGGTWSCGRHQVTSPAAKKNGTRQQHGDLRKGLAGCFSDGSYSRARTSKQRPFIEVCTL